MRNDHLGVVVPRREWDSQRREGVDILAVPLQRQHERAVGLRLADFAQRVDRRQRGAQRLREQTRESLAIGDVIEEELEELAGLGPQVWDPVAAERGHVLGKVLVRGWALLRARPVVHPEHIVDEPPRLEVGARQCTHADHAGRVEEV